MAPVRICVATRDGQAERIARHVSRRLADCGIADELHVLPSASLTGDVLAGSPLVLVVAAVRYGHHLPEAEGFLAHFSKIDAPPPLAFASVNLTARKEGKQSAETNPYLRKTLARHGLNPVVACAIAGRLDYPRYGWFDRNMIRFIMAMTGGPTDGRSTIEYTRWEQVDAFAGALADVVKPGSGGVRAADGALARSE